ncbi:MAG: cysteine desulfurase, partial [Bacteroidetes bacterium]|nr:cysteine desulfurase [Bacteroidota bacterium]
MIYLDNAATTPLDPEVIEVMSDTMKNYHGNPSSVHTFGREARVLIENARKTVSSFLNVSPSEIFFTSCGTEAINTAISGCVNDLGIRHFVTSHIEHHATLHSLEKHIKNNLCTISYIKLDAKGKVDLEDLKKILHAKGRSLVCLMHANNEIGNLLPLKETSEICSQSGSLFLCDTVQTIGKVKNDIGAAHIDFAICSAHKFHGPKGIGFLYKNGDINISPLIKGGGQERNMRSGTENIYGIVGLAKAMEVAFKNIDTDTSHILSLKSLMIKRLREEIPEIIFNGESAEKGLHTILNVSFPKTKKSEMLLYNL